MVLKLQSTSESPGRFVKKMAGGFPGGTLVGSPPASAGDSGSIAGQGGSHVLWSKYALEPQLLSPHATTTEVCMPGAHGLQQDRPPQ